MIQRLALEKSLVCVLALATVLCAELPAHGQKQPPYELTVSDKKAAQELAESTFEKERGLDKKEKIFVTKVELIPTKYKDDEKPRSLDRTVVVTHYRYKNDEAILSTVDLNTKKVLKVVAIPHFPTALAEEEFAEAKKLALATPEVKKLLAPYEDKVKFGALVPRVESEKDPAFGHRLVQMLFRVGPDYLSSMRVLVDLTSETVSIDTKGPLEQHSAK